MKQFLYSLAFGALLALMSCSHAPSTTLFDQITKQRDGKLLYGTSAYTETITSVGGDFLNISVEKGIIKKIKALHSNGKLIDAQIFYLRHGDIDERMEACFTEMQRSK